MVQKEGDGLLRFCRFVGLQFGRCKALCIDVKLSCTMVLDLDQRHDDEFALELPEVDCFGVGVDDFFKLFESEEQERNPAKL
jgi:hypothetical protein